MQDAASQESSLEASCDDTFSRRLTVYIVAGVAGAVGLFVLLNGAEQKGWARPNQGVATGATIERIQRGDECSVTSRRSRCYHLSLAIDGSTDANRELDVNIEDAQVHRFVTGGTTRVVALRDGTIALDRTLVEP